MSLSIYPSGLDGFTDKVDYVDNVMAVHVNSLQHAVSGLQYTLGRTQAPAATATYRAALPCYVAQAELRVSGLSSQVPYLIPSGTLVLGATYRWTTAPTTGAGFLHFGVSGNIYAWADTVGISGLTGDPSQYTIGGPTWFPQGAHVVVTASGGEIGGGRMLVAVTYVSLLPPEV